MASYVLSENDRRELQKLITWWKGGGAGRSNRAPSLRRRTRGLIKPKDPPGVLRHGLVVGGIPAMIIDPATEIITPGVTETAVVKLLIWNETEDALIVDPEEVPIRARNASSHSQVVASADEPVVLTGVVNELEDELIFVILQFDLYTLDGNDFGSPAQNGIDISMKIPFKSGASREYTVDSEACTNATP